jgi:hypothetical protein
MEEKRKTPSIIKKVSPDKILYHKAEEELSITLSV